MDKYQSMTGFGRGEVSKEEFDVLVEVKSVNHRFKDIRIKGPSLFTPIENDLRKLIKENFKRGSFDIYLAFKKGEGAGALDLIDLEKVKSFLKVFSDISGEISVPLNFSPSEFLKQEFYRDSAFLDRDNEELYSLTKEALEKALGELKKSRGMEGEKLKGVIESHKNRYKDLSQQLKENIKGVEDEVRARLNNRFKEFSEDLNLDEGRFMQEVVYYLEKLDISEELDRINGHLQKFEKFLSDGGELGRRIDFLVQELNRETNTIGSKSSKQEVLDLVIQMKVELEKIREQALNLE